MCNRTRWAFLGLCVFWVSMGPGIPQPARGEIIQGQYWAVTPSSTGDLLNLSNGVVSFSDPISVGAAGFSPLTVKKIPPGAMEKTFSLTELYDSANCPLPNAIFDIGLQSFNPSNTILTIHLSPTSGELWPSALLPLPEFADTTITVALFDITLDQDSKWILGRNARVTLTMTTGEQPPGGSMVQPGPAAVPAPDSLVLALAGITLLFCAGLCQRRRLAVKSAG